MAKGKAKKNNAKAAKSKLRKSHERSPSKIDSVSKVGGSDCRTDKVVGLENLGNTCFFNSVLQNLVSLEEVRTQYGAPATAPGEGEQRPLQSSLRVLLQGIQSATKVYNPRPVFDAICKRAPQFKSMQQQDSHELLRFLLDGLQTEEKDALKKSQSGEGRAPVSWVDRMFGGELVWSTTCQECHTLSAVSEPFLDLSLSIPTEPLPKSGIEETKGKMISPTKNWMSAKERKRAEKEKAKEEKKAKKKGKAEKSACAHKDAEEREDEPKEQDEQGFQCKADVDMETTVESTVPTHKWKSQDAESPVDVHKHEANTINVDLNISADSGVRVTFDPQLPVDNQSRRGSISDEDVQSHKSGPRRAGSMLSVQDYSGELDADSAKGSYEHVEHAAVSEPLMSWEEGVVGLGEVKNSRQPTSTPNSVCGAAEDSFSSDSEAGSAHRFWERRELEVEREMADTMDAFADAFSRLSTSAASGGGQLSPTAAHYLGGAHGAGFNSDMEAEDDDADFMGGGVVGRPLDHMHLPTDELELEDVRRWSCSDEDGDLMNVSPTGMGSRDMDFASESIAKDFGNDLVKNIESLARKSDCENRPNGGSSEVGGEEEWGAVDLVPIVDEDGEDGEAHRRTVENGEGESEPTSGNGTKGRWDCNQENTETNGGGGDAAASANDSGNGVMNGDKSGSVETGMGFVIVEQSKEEQSVDVGSTSRRPSESEHLSVYSCWRSFIVPEELSGDSAYACEECSRRAARAAKFAPRSSSSASSRKSKRPPKRKVKSKAPCVVQSTQEDESRSVVESSAPTPNETKRGNHVADDSVSVASDRTMEYDPFSESTRPGTAEKEGALLSNGAPDGESETSSSLCTESHNSVGNYKVECGHSAIVHSESSLCASEWVKATITVHENDIQVTLNAVELDKKPELLQEGETCDSTSNLVGGQEQGTGGENKDLDEDDEEMEEEEEGDEEEEEDNDNEAKDRPLVLRDAVREVMVKRAPKILTVHLKRFQQDMRGRLTKIQTHVEFEEELMLDVQDIDMDTDMSQVDLKTRSKLHRKTRVVKYSLVGVVNHMGTMRGGHYVAYVRRPSKEEGASEWYYCSDRSVNPVSFETVQACDAYLLFFSLVE